VQPNIVAPLEVIIHDLELRNELLFDLVQDNSFIENNAALCTACDMSLRKLVECGQMKRTTNIFARGYYKHGIYINLEQSKKPYVVVKMHHSKSSFPMPDWIKNPADEDFFERKVDDGAVHGQGTKRAPVDTIKPKTKKRRTDPWCKRNRKKSAKRKRNHEDGVAKKKKAKTAKRFKGGFVCEQVPGLYNTIDRIVTTVDWASLYPSTMVENKICYRKVLYDKALLDDPRATLCFVPINDTECIVFVTHYDGVEVMTITDLLVGQVMKERKRVRKAMKTMTNPFAIASANAMQLTCKVLQNSVYGYVGSTMAPFPCTALAAATTAISRWMNISARDVAMKRGYYCVFGDTDSLGLIVPLPKGHNFGQEEAIKYVHKEVTEYCDIITAPYGEPQEYELESMKFPHYIPSKKKKVYAAEEFANDVKNGHFKSKSLIKGFVFKKRGIFEGAAITSKAVLQTILDSGGRGQEIVDIVAQFLANFTTDIHDMVSLRQFILTVNLAANYKCENSPGQVLAAMILEEQGRAVGPGSRMAYVVTRTPGAEKLVEKISTVSSYLSKGKTIDAEYYLGKQLYGGLKQMLQLPQHVPVLEACKKLIDQRVGELCNLSMTL
jgi:DNA polymerase elongation subunit (family B)